MAEGQKIGGYQCEFVGPVPEELLCKSCKLVAKKVYTTDCCTERFCQACIEQALNDKKPCPSCGEAEFSAFFIKGAQKKIQALQVHCALKQKGCEWVGQLEQLDAHLDTDCQYVDVECPSKCNKKVQKRNLATHLEMDCHKREFMCPYCTYKATFEIVSNVHWPECLLFPLKCPNRCGVTCEREFIDDHMQICSLEEVECILSFAGCKEKFLREDQDKHTKRNVERHLELTATETLRTKQELQEKDQQIRELQESHKQVQQHLQEKDAELKEELTKRDDELKTKLEERDETLKALKDDMNRELKKRDDELKAKLEERDETLKALKDDMNRELKKRDDELKPKLEERDEAMKALKDDMNQELKKREAELKAKLEERDEAHAAEVTALKKLLQETDQKLSKETNTLHMAAGILPYHLTMANYAEQKRNNSYWSSERFYTHPGGYRCYISVVPNGQGRRRGTHVSVQLCSVAGQFDGTLPWPAKATFTLQLLNQHRDQDHWTVTKNLEWTKSTIITFVANFSKTFIPHAELGWNAGKQTHYLKDDTLQFRITKIEPHK